LLTVSDVDQRRLVDLDNPLSVEALVDLVKGRDQVLLEEFWPGPEQLCARSDEGRFVSELVIPIIREPPPAPASAASSEPVSVRRPPAPDRAVARVFVPGTEWLYAKLYTGAATADRVLLRVLADIPRGELSDRWFFIVLDDPDYHVRLRFHGEPERLRGELWPAVERAVAPLLDGGLVRRVVLDTYEREIERYGGPAGIELAERVFHHDSEAALAILGMLEPGDAGARERWQITACGAGMLLADLGLDAEQSLQLLERLRARYGHMLRADRALGRAIGRQLREHQATLELLLDPRSQGAGTGLEPGVRVLQRRSEALAPLVAELDRLDRRGELAVARPALAASFMHLHFFRLLRASHRRQELVIYDFLLQLTRSAAARARAQSS
jgi:thiopeptide-type bacteriocin biosynthesis protein